MASRNTINLSDTSRFSFFLPACWCSVVQCPLPWFPLGLEIRENLEKWEGIFQSRKLSKWEKSGNFTQNTGKIAKNYTGKFKGILESQGNLSASNSENPANMVPYFKSKMNFKKYWKTVKNTGKVGEICQSEKMGTMSNLPYLFIHDVQIFVVALALSVVLCYYFHPYLF